MSRIATGMARSLEADPPVSLAGVSIIGFKETSGVFETRKGGAGSYLQPGPPFNQIVISSSAAGFSEGKYQK